MRKLLLIFLVLTLVACVHLESRSALGGRAAATCPGTAAPWILAAGEGADVAIAEPTAPILRAVTYNIHSGMGQWRGLWRSRSTVQRHLDGIADTLAASSTEPLDVIALNEVDFTARRSGRLDQARYLADALQRRTGASYDVIYGRTRERRLPGFEGGYGNAALVRHPVSARKTCLYDDAPGCGALVARELPGLRAPGMLPRLVREARGVIAFTVDFHGHAVDVVVTHLDALAMAEREAQAAHLLYRFVDPARTTIVLGDINAVPTGMTATRAFFRSDRTHDILTSGALADARVLVASRLRLEDFRAWATYPATAPAWPLDAALATLDLYPQELRVLDGLHSDHRGLFVAYRLARDSAVPAAQRALHDTVRRRQLTRILHCDVSNAERTAKLHWLKTGTQFLDLAPDIESVDASALTDSTLVASP
jgi:endonuclease/exonuclease/phosphatase family metal-dependent hydrolase